MSWKKSALVRSKILGLFVNTLTAEYTYSRRNMQTLTQQVQTPLSLKQKTFSWFFIAFLKSTWNGEHFEKKGESSSLSISEIIDSKRGGYLSAWIQTPLSWKQKTFSWFFIAFLKSTWNGEHFEKKGESSSLSISEIIDSKRGGYLSAWKALL